MLCAPPIPVNSCVDLGCQHVKPASRKGWTIDEDTLIRTLVIKYGTKAWTQVAPYLNGRSSKQCRERWHNHLDPTLRKSNWSVEEDRVIVACQSVTGNNWAAISKHLPGRSDNAIKNRWNSTLARGQRIEHTLINGTMPLLPGSFSRPGEFPPPCPLAVCAAPSEWILPVALPTGLPISEHLNTMTYCPGFASHAMAHATVTASAAPPPSAHVAASYFVHALSASTSLAQCLAHQSSSAAGGGVVPQPQPAHQSLLASTVCTLLSTDNHADLADAAARLHNLLPGSTYKQSDVPPKKRARDVGETTPETTPSTTRATSPSQDDVQLEPVMHPRAKAARHLPVSDAGVSFGLGA